MKKGTILTIAVGFILLIALMVWKLMGIENPNGPNRPVSDALSTDMAISKTGKSEIAIENPSKINCLKGVQESELVEIYTGMHEDRYELPDDILNCIKSNYKVVSKQRIKQGDYFLNINNQLVHYKSLGMTGRDVIIIDR